MKYRRLGKTNLRVSVIGMGTWQLGGEWGKNYTQAEVDPMFDAAREFGINLIDTAECYGDHTSESFVGSAIARDREKWIVATKFGHIFDGMFSRVDARTPADVNKQVEASLKSLRTDYIDLLQYHSLPDVDFDNDALTDALVALVKAGKVRHLGNSIGGKGNSEHQCSDSPNRHLETIQLIYNRLDRKPEEKILPICQALDLGVLARVPLASGFLSGKYKPGATFDSSDTRSRKKQESRDERLRQAQEIQQTEVPPGVNMAQWTLAWCLKHPAISAVIPGCKDADQVKSNAAAVELMQPDHPQDWK